jgi:16S rRNA (cytosine967-C5)-methyltransferase
MQPPRGPTPKTRRPDPPAPSGLAAREAAVAALVSVLDRGRGLDEAFDASLARAGAMEARDRGLARLIVLTVLRHKGELDAVLGTFLEKPLPADSGRLRSILLSGAAQLLILDTPPHAAISLAVDQCRLDARARRFDKLTNAVLRRVAGTGREILATLDPIAANIPDWLMARWVAAYGGALARDIAQASLREAPLDLTVKSDAAGWAERLGGIVLSTGTVRIARTGRVEDLPGFADGAWWVQDAAAALPARLLGAVAGLSVADLCAAPGGKTAQLAAEGADVTAVDQAPQRLGRLRDNLSRLGLTAAVVEADILAWDPGRTFDAVLLDAPCSATGTIRRHPDILHLRRKSEIEERVPLQRSLMSRAARLVGPGGLLVTCTCSLEPEEGPEQIAHFLREHAEFQRLPIAPGEAGIDGQWLTGDGDLRTLPCHLPLAEAPGMDGFFAARLKKVG